MAITAGFEQFSILSNNGSNPGPRCPLPEVILPNSLMSAPATKVRPPPIITADFTLSSLSIRSIASEIPSGTPGLNAFTGGLLIVMTAISLSLLNSTRSLISDFSPNRTLMRSWKVGPNGRPHDQQAIPDPSPTHFAAGA